MDKKKLIEKICSDFIAWCGIFPVSKKELVSKIENFLKEKHYHVSSKRIYKGLDLKWVKK